MLILGISCWYHDSAACLIRNGEILSAAQEERFTRIKHDESFPINSINFCLNSNNININDLDHIVFYEKPILKFDRIFETHLAFVPYGFKSFMKSMPLWLKDKIYQKKKLINIFSNNFELKSSIEKKLLFSEHHLSHAASAFYPSPLEDSAILTLDGVGEWTTTSIAHGLHNDIIFKKHIKFPHSIGLLYSAFTYYLGFKVNSGEYKVMGLAPYGEPKYTNIIKEKLIEIKNDGSFRLNMEFFDFATDLKMTNKKFEQIFNKKRRKPESTLLQNDMDIAASIQEVTEELVLNLAREAKKITGSKNLCLAGGVALNCVANGKILKENIFEKIWIQPASGDAGCALGAALAVYYLKYNQNRKINLSDSMHGSLLGPKFDSFEVENELNNLGGIFSKYEYDEIPKRTAKFLSSGLAIGWMQGKMEFGPRALGSRSILANPLIKDMQKKLNLKIKFRESFRPFAPSILRKKTSDWFDLQSESPYMLLVDNVKSSQLYKQGSKKKLFGIEKLNSIRSKVPAITHVDYSARIQTVDEVRNPIFFELIEEFEKISGCPILVNTSFNVRGEPIVCSVSDAFKCFMATDLDILVIENFILKKEDQDITLKKKYHHQYELD